MHIYKIYDKDTNEQVAIEDDLTAARKMALLSVTQIHKLFRNGRVSTDHFVIVQY